MKIITETKRLIIREIGAEDIEKMLALHSDPEVHTYLGNKTITSRDKIVEVTESLKKQYTDFGVGRWAMIDKKTNEFIGWTGLEFVTKEINSCKNFYDLGYRLLKKFWGQGFASESAFASLEYGFNKLKIDEIFAMADIENVASNNILKKVGLQFVETFDLESIKHNWYQIKRSDYENQNH